jgi:uncharacterized membrane protein
MKVNFKIKSKIFFRRVFEYFLQGLLYIAPLAVTFYVIYMVFGMVNGLSQDYIDEIIGFKIPGLGVILLFVVITMAGFFGQRLISQPIKVIIEKLLGKAPIIQVVYTSIRDFLSAFVGKEKKFTQPVLVKVNKSAELEKIGFLTASDLTDLNIKDKVAVYFPHSYAFSGELFIVPTELVTKLDIHPAEAMKFIVSGGISKLSNDAV